MQDLFHIKGNGIEESAHQNNFTILLHPREILAPIFVMKQGDYGKGSSAIGSKRTL